MSSESQEMQRFDTPYETLVYGDRDDLSDK